MTPRKRIRTPLAEIDVNVDLDIDSNVGQQEEELFCLPDLNIIVEESLESDFGLNSDLVEISLSMEDDTQLEATPLEDYLNLHSDTEITHGSHRKRNLTNEECQSVYDLLLLKSIDGNLKRGTTKMVASLFSVNIYMIQRICRRAKNSLPFVDVSSKKTKNCGRKRVEVDLDRLRQISLHQQTTLRSLSNSSNISKSTLHRRFQAGDIRRHSSALKPFLTEDNKISRLKFCLSMLEEKSIPLEPSFKEIYNIVHIDEKWFHMTKNTEKIYMLPYDEDHYRACKSKNFIGKVMFLVALARPRFDAEGNELFSGKNGVFPLVTQEPAKRNSVNRGAGTLVTKPITSITRGVMWSYMIEKVLPAIKEKWPREDSGFLIFIQQDNARTHIQRDDEQFCRATKEDDFDIRLMCQPPNSPDLNVLDLGFFSANQSLQQKANMRNVDELISAVVKSFEDYPSEKSNRVFLTLQSCMIEMMKLKVSNKYKIPHMKKEALERDDMSAIYLKKR